MAESPYSSRSEKSLSTLTVKFVEMLREGDGPLDLNHVNIYMPLLIFAVFVKLSELNRWINCRQRDRWRWPRSDASMTSPMCSRASI